MMMLRNSSYKAFPVYIIFGWLLLCGSSVFAQKKYEREYSMKKTGVPARALDFIEDAFKGEKVHWYGEESLTGHTIEAKLRSGGKQYSIEFSKEGDMQDVEIRSRFSALPETVRKNISAGLEKKFKNFRIMKTQVQWTGSESILKKGLSAENLPVGIVVRYELVVKGRQTGIQQYYEILCDDRGSIEQSREIIQRNADNLIY